MTSPDTRDIVRTMDRKVPDVFDVFGIGEVLNLEFFVLGMIQIILGGPFIPNTPKGGIALPGLVTRREDIQYAWSDRLDR